MSAYEVTLYTYVSSEITYQYNVINEGLTGNDSDMYVWPMVLKL